MEDDDRNIAQRHRFGGVEPEPLSSHRPVWVIGALVALAAFWTGVVLLVRWLT